MWSCEAICWLTPWICAACFAVISIFTGNRSSGDHADHAEALSGLFGVLGVILVFIAHCFTPQIYGAWWWISLLLNAVFCLLIISKTAYATYLRYKKTPQE